LLGAGLRGVCSNFSAEIRQAFVRVAEEVAS